jgi:hypothetical protein
MIIGGFSDVVYCIIILEILDRHSAYILLLLECTYWYLYVYYPVIITRYLTSKSSEINYELREVGLQ